MSERQRDPIVVEQSNMSVNVLWGFLSVVFALVLWLGHQGAETEAGRLVVDILFGAAVIISVGAWISFHRNPAQLEISQDLISFSHRGKANSVELLRTGDLYVQTRIGPRGTVHRYLKVSGSDDGIQLVLFNWKEVERACRAAGWRIGTPRRTKEGERSPG